MAHKTKEHDVRCLEPEQAHTDLEQNSQAILVCAYDDEKSFEANHLEGAISLEDFLAKSDSIPKETEIIFYCDCPHDEAARKRAGEAQRAGFTNVNVLAEGASGWKSAGYQTV